MKTLLLTALFILFSIGLTFSQTGEQTSSEFSTANSAKAEGTDLSFSDGYMGYKDQILLRLVAKEIPENFPKPRMGQTRDEYKQSMLNWFEENLNLVKEEYHSNLK